MRASLAGLLWGGVCAFILFSAAPVWDHVAVNRELHGVYVPKYEYSAAVESDLRLPLWNPYDFCGLPMLGITYGTSLYPPIIVSFAIFPAKLALQVVYLFHILLFAWAGTLYVARSGISPWLAGVAPLIGLAGLFTDWAYVGIDHPPMLMSLAWIPVQFLCWQNATRPGGRRWIAILALATGMQGLAGYQEYVIDTALMLGVLALLGGDTPGVPLIRRIGVLPIGIGLGIGLAAVQLFPLREVLAESSRASLELKGMFHTLFHVDTWHDFEITPVRPAFAAALLLALASLSKLDRRRIAWWVIFAWTVFPGNLPFSLIYKIPPLHLMRHLLGWNNSSGFFLGILAVAGAWALFQSRRTWLRGAGIAALVIAIVQASYLVHIAPTRLPASAPDRELLAQRAEILHRLRDEYEPKPRVLAHSELLGASTLRHEIPSAAGFEPAFPPVRLDRLLSSLGVTQQALVLGRTAARWRGVEERPEVVRLLGVGLLVTPEARAKAFEAKGFRRVGTLPPDEVVLYQRPIARARLVHRAVTVPDEAASLEHILSHAGDAAHTVVLEDGTGSVELSEPPRGAMEKVVISTDEPERLVIDVEAAAPGLLAVTDTYFPGWHVTVDGKPEEILRVDYTFRGVRIPAGSHQVVFEFRPASLRTGFLVSTIALFGTLAVLLAPARRRPRR